MFAEKNIYDILSIMEIDDLKQQAKQEKKKIKKEYKEKKKTIKLSYQAKLDELLKSDETIAKINPPKRTILE